MTRLILTRLLIAIPLLLAISFTAFILKDVMQSDEINMNPEDQGRAPARSYTEKRIVSISDDRELPLFYFSIKPLAYPDSLFKIENKIHRQRIKRFLRQGIAWRYLNDYLDRENALLSKPEIQSSNLEYLQSIQKTGELLTELNNIPDSIKRYSETRDMIRMVKEMIASRNYVSLFIPSLKWYGFKNRYHNWLKKIMQGDWGNSRVDYRPSWTKIKEAISWTLMINFISLILVFGFAILLGEWLFLHHQKRRGKLVETMLFFIYSIPRFFLAILLIQFFASDTIHPNLHFFPSPGFFDSDPEASMFQRLIRYGNQLVLPVISIVLPSLAYLTRIYANKLLDEKAKPYAFMAWSKGDSPGFITQHHLRRNALMPLVALLGLEIPALIGGSVVIEVLFNLPGMGRLMLQSIVMQDWVIVFNILLLTGVFTILGKLVSDILYTLLDPRVSWSKQ